MEKSLNRSAVSSLDCVGAVVHCCRCDFGSCRHRTHTLIRWVEPSTSMLRSHKLCSTNTDVLLAIDGDSCESKDNKLRWQFRSWYSFWQHSSRVVSRERSSRQYFIYLILPCSVLQNIITVTTHFWNPFWTNFSLQILAAAAPHTNLYLHIFAAIQEIRNRNKKKFVPSLLRRSLHAACFTLTRVQQFEEIIFYQLRLIFGVLIPVLFFRSSRIVVLHLIMRLFAVCLSLLFPLFDFTGNASTSDWRCRQTEESFCVLIYNWQIWLYLLIRFLHHFGEELCIDGRLSRESGSN